MTLTFPGSPFYDIASSTNPIIAAIAPTALVVIGVYMAFLVIEILIDILAKRLWPEPPAHPPLM